MILSSFFRKKQQAFTLIEIIAVIVIISVLSSLSYVQYNRVRERSIAERVRVDLLSIQAALELWRIKKPNQTMSPSLPGIAGLNQVLGLNISDEYFDYSFGGAVASGYTVIATRKPTTAYTMMMSAMGAPICCSGECPSQLFPACN